MRTPKLRVTMAFRILRDVDPKVGPSVSASQMQEVISKVSDRFPPLYARKWIKTPAAEVADKEGVTTITHLQYNILAQGLSHGVETPPCAVDAQNRNKLYGGFDGVQQPDVVFNFDSRKVRILEDILRFDPTIITLQECDHFYSFFLPALQKVGYDGMFQPKKNAPGLFAGYYSDGVAILWKTSVLERSEEGTTSDHSIVDGGTTVKVPHIVIHFKEIASQRTLVVATTHLKSKPDHEETRYKQIKAVLSKLEKEKDKADAFILAGDFNADSFTINWKGQDVAPKVVRSVLSSNLKSAYPLPQGEEDLSYTTWKTRGDTESRRVIDYIFHDSNLQATEFLLAPNPADIEPNKLPGLRAPSDHLPVAAKFCFLNFVLNRCISNGLK